MLVPVLHLDSLAGENPFHELGTFNSVPTQMPEPILSDLAPNVELFDFQVNGFAGVDFQSEDLREKQVVQAVAGLRAHQTTAILFTLVTDTVDRLCRKLERMETIRRTNQEIAAVVRGYHLEGPWISREPGYHGAHPVKLARDATMPDYHRLRDAAEGNLRLITLAPEVEGCIEIIEAATAGGIRIGLGHTNASDTDIDAAIRAGATLATHLGNAVPLHVHRHDNVIQRLLARDELIACFIPDGLHLPPFVLKNFYRAKPAGKVFFTTDCMAAAGAPPGRYTMHHHTLDVGTDGIVHLPGDKRFAGSSLTLDRGIRNIMNWLALDADTAIEMCSNLPATHFGIRL
jgi:N-acetylglucosamine-6-phosphate deacetylase